MHSSWQQETAISVPSVFLGMVIDNSNATQAFYGGRWGMKIESRCFRESKVDKWMGRYGGSTSEW